GLHFWEDDTLVEVLDPEGTEPVGDRERGELVATALVNRTTPLIRYRSDDIVRLTRVPCPCGRTHAKLWPVGRKGDGVEVDGKKILPIDVWSAVDPEVRANPHRLTCSILPVDDAQLAVVAAFGIACPAPGGAPRPREP
ncbi:MAG TPA: hypothetical protein VD764_09075, partial [Nocardioides sp.]|nr:hypothetical protein [Nocardioides sp.]